jgi:hypothetical protein
MSRVANKDELKERLSEAGQRVTISGKYQHFRTKGVYAVRELVLIEATEEVGVVYQAEDGLLWLRTVDNFCELVDGVERFRKVDAKKK